MSKKNTKVMNMAGGEIVLYQPDESIKLYSQDAIQSRILAVRGVQVIMDRDLAVMYGVETRIINQAVKRNPLRFPEDFYFQLTKTEWEYLMSQYETSKSQNVILENTSKTGRGYNLKYLPYVFTEEGVGQLSAVPRKTKINVFRFAKTDMFFRTLRERNNLCKIKLKHLCIRTSETTSSSKGFSEEGKTRTCSSKC